MELGFTYYQAKQSFLANIRARLAFKRNIIRLTRKHNISGFTLLKALGAWEGKTEPSYQMYLIGVPQATVRALAADFRDAFKQDAVMVKNGRKVEFI